MKVTIKRKVKKTLTQLNATPEGKDKQGRPYTEGNRATRRHKAKMVRTTVQRDRKQALADARDKSKKAIAERVKRNQDAAHERAVARKVEPRVPFVTRAMRVLQTANQRRIDARKRRREAYNRRHQKTV
jgi:hypothetical protein